MLYPAVVSAAAAAVGLLAVLGPGLSLPAEHNSESSFSLCSDCFYRQTPPQGVSAGLLLHPLCHRLPGGQAFATLSRPTCDTAVYSAFHLSHGWTEREEEEEPLTEEDGDRIKVGVPALLKGNRDPTHLVSAPLKQWDSTVTGLVKSKISPQCSTLGGDIYILLGAGGLGAVEDGNECLTTPLWSAVCCAHPEGKGGFSVGLIKETEEERQVSIKELEEMLGVTQLFSEGCGGKDEETAAIRKGLHSEAPPGNMEKLKEDTTDGDSGNAGSDTNEAVTERRQVYEQVAGVDACSEKADVSHFTQGATTDTATSLRSSDIQHDDQESVRDEEADSNSSSTLIFIMSTTFSILKLPLQPVISTVTQLPGQVSYILQEDLGVLAGLPGITFDLLHLFTSDLLSYTGSAAEMLLGISETCVSNVYYCSSSMLGALLNSCHTGFTGMGTLAGDTVGIFGNALDNIWSVTKFFGERLYEQSEGYVGTVMSEIGSQAQTLGGGFGKLVWRSGNGVGHVFRFGGGVIMMMVEVVAGTVREAFGQESE